MLLLGLIIGALTGFAFGYAFARTTYEEQPSDGYSLGPLEDE